MNQCLDEVRLICSKPKCSSYENRSVCPYSGASLLIIGFVQPGMAAENDTKDAATVFYNTGVTLLENREYARAIEAFDQALAANTTMIRQSDALLYTYQNKGYALIQLNN